MNKVLRRLLNLSLVLPLLIGLSGCFDLGSFGEDGGGTVTSVVKESDYENYYKAYYDAVGDIILYSQDETSETYSLIGDFFNKETVNDMKCTVPENEYICLAFEIKKDLSIEALSLYVKASEDVTTKLDLDVYLFQVDSTSLSKLCPYNVNPLYVVDDDGEYIYDINGNKEYQPFDLPNKSKAIGSESLKVSGSAWSSFTINRFNGKKTLEIKDGKCLLVCFYNNTGYQKGLNEDIKDASLKRQKVSIKLTNLLIRAN